MGKQVRGGRQSVAVLISCIRKLKILPYSNHFFLNIKDTLYLYNVIYQLYLNKGEKKMAKEVLTVISHGTYNMFIIEADH